MKMNATMHTNKSVSKRGVSACLFGLGLSLGLILVPELRAEFPVEDMDSHSLGIQYGFALRGQNITHAEIPSHETLHLLSLAYAPVPYASLEAGIGIDQLAVDPVNHFGFHGDFGISPTLGFSLFSPALLDLLRVTTGSKALFLQSEDAYGYRYSGWINNPFLGLLVSPSSFVNVAAGARMVLIDGKMRTPIGAEKPFANGNMLRGYLSVTLKSPGEKVFLTLDVDMSPSVNADWSKGPQEASVGIAFGAALGGKAHNSISADSSRYFPAFPDMKKRQDKMAGEIE